MADVIDQAQFIEERERQLSLRARRPTLQPIGVCYSCDAEVDPGRLFCDCDCREDWERAEAARKREGRQ